MTTYEKYGYWLMLSDYDIETAEVLVRAERWVYSVYLCQQSIERQLKGMYVFFFGTEAPKSHNLNFLFLKLAEKLEKADEPIASLFAAHRDECEDFMTDLMFFYMTDYPFSYKNITSRFVSPQTAIALYDKTKAQLAWLRSFMPGAEPMRMPEKR